MKKTKHFIVLLLCVSALHLFPSGTTREQLEATKEKAPRKPNIVIFVADDLGYSDTEPYGNKVVKTPG